MNRFANIEIIRITDLVPFTPVVSLKIYVSRVESVMLENSVPKIVILAGNYFLIEFALWFCYCCKIQVAVYTIYRYTGTSEF